MVTAIKGYFFWRARGASEISGNARFDASGRINSGVAGWAKRIFSGLVSCRNANLVFP